MEFSVLLVLAAAFFFGLGDYLTKKATGSASYLNYMLAANASIVFFAFSMFEPYSLEGIPLLFVVCTAYLIASYSFYKALANDRVGIVAPITSTFALVTVLLGVTFGGESFSAVQIGATAFAMFGVALTLLEDLRQLKTISRSTMAAGGMAMLAWGWGVYEMKYLSQIYSGAQVAFSISLFFLIAGALGIMWKKEKIVLGKGALFAALAGFSWNLGVVAFNTSLQDIEVSFASALSSFYPLVPLVLGIFIEKEKIRKHQLAGIAMTVIGIAAIYLLK